jgi:hypothetical protein
LEERCSDPKGLSLLSSDSTAPQKSQQLSRLSDYSQSINAITLHQFIRGIHVG